MRTLLLLGTGFWLFIGATVSPVAYALVAACLMLLAADYIMRLNARRVKRLDMRIERWCNPAPLPQTRGLPINPNLGTPSVRAAGRGAGIGATTGRHSTLEIKPIRTEPRRVQRAERTSIEVKHPGQDSNLQPAD